MIVAANGTDWPAVFAYIDAGHTQKQAAEKFGIHEKSISRKKSEMKRVTSRVTKPMLPKTTKPMAPKISTAGVTKVTSRVTLPEKYIPDIIDAIDTWMSAYKKYGNKKTVRQRERMEGILKYMEGLK